MKSGTSRTNILRRKFILPKRNFVGIYVVRIFLEKKGKSSRVDRKDRVVKSYCVRRSSEQLAQFAYAAIPKSPSYSQRRQRIISFRRIFPPSLSPNLDYFDEQRIGFHLTCRNRERGSISSLARARQRRGIGWNLLAMKSGIRFAANSRQIFSRTTFYLSKKSESRRVKWYNDNLIASVKLYLYYIINFQQFISLNSHSHNIQIYGT